MAARIPIPTELIAAFCRRWRIAELALFGSVLTDKFRPTSDIDILVSFAPETRYTLFDRVHGYFDVDLEKVWETVHRDIPSLIAAVEPLIAPGPS